MSAQVEYGNGESQFIHFSVCASNVCQMWNKISIVLRSATRNSFLGIESHFPFRSSRWQLSKWLDPIQIGLVTSMTAINALMAFRVDGPLQACENEAIESTCVMLHEFDLYEQSSSARLKITWLWKHLHILMIFRWFLTFTPNIILSLTFNSQVQHIGWIYFVFVVFPYIFLFHSIHTSNRIEMQIMRQSIARLIFFPSDIFSFHSHCIGMPMEWTWICN